MRSTIHRQIVRPVLALGLVALFSGCAVLNVEMTSTPETVRGGEPVTFDLKATNRSQCPVFGAAVEIIAFIPVDEFNAAFEDEFGGGNPSDVPPEVLEFFQELRMFFDELCAGGTPDFPEPPMFSTSCGRGEGDIVCTMSGALSSHEGNIGSMSFGLLANQLRCEINDASVSCQLHVPLPKGAPGAGGTGAAATKALECLTTDELNGGLIEGPCRSAVRSREFPERRGTGAGRDGNRPGDASGSR